MVALDRLPGAALVPSLRHVAACKLPDWRQEGLQGFSAARHECGAVGSRVAQFAFPSLHERRQRHPRRSRRRAAPCTSLPWDPRRPCSPWPAPTLGERAVAAASPCECRCPGSTRRTLAPQARCCPCGHRCCSCASGCVAVAACRWAPSPSSWLLGAPGRGLAANAGVVGCPEPIGRGGRGGMTD